MRLAIPAAIAMTLAACGAAASSPEVTPQQGAATAIATLASGAHISAATYARIKDGMTMAQVRALLGNSGLGQSQTDDGHGTTSSVLMWQPPDQRSGIIVAFVNDKVVSKSSVGI